MERRIKVNTARRARAIRGPGARGFTMIELTLVLLILAVTAMIAVPMMSTFGRGRKLSDTAGQLLALTRHAQDKAMAEGRSARLEIDASGGVFTLLVDGPDGYTTVDTGAAARFEVDPGVKISWEGVSDAATQGYIQFDGDGGHDVATVRVTGSDGRAVLLGTDGPTEGFRIVPADGGGV